MSAAELLVTSPQKLRHFSGGVSLVRPVGGKVAGVREAIEAVGAKLRYLPAYSPDLNPIENVYSKLKSLLRKGAARTVDALTKLVGRSIKAIAPSECAGYVRHAGYRA